MITTSDGDGEHETVSEDDRDEFQGSIPAATPDASRADGAGSGVGAARSRSPRTRRRWETGHRGLTRPPESPAHV